MKPLIAAGSIVLLCVACARAAPPISPPLAPTAAPPRPTTPTTAPTLIWPSLSELEPAQAAPGQPIWIVGAGGYLRTPDGGYNESRRTFKLYFDRQEAGSLSCYVNRCEGTALVPATAAPGVHQVSAEGGSVVLLQVI